MVQRPYLSSYNQQLSSSTAIIAASSQWNSVELEVRAQVHAADFWKPAGPMITMAEVRDLQVFASMSPVGSWKVACIPSADSLKIEVANALLKLIEEPPGYLCMLLCAVTPNLLPTVRSRVRAIERVEGDGAQDSHAWKKALKSYSPELAAQRKVLAHLLYWYPLVHQSVKTDTVLDPFTF
jgi:hypothetical protein